MANVTPEIKQVGGSFVVIVGDCIVAFRPDREAAEELVKLLLDGAIPNYGRREAL